MAKETQRLQARVADVTDEVLHAILEVVSDGLWDWNANTGYVYRSPGWYEMLGYGAHSLHNTVHTWESVIHPEDVARVMAHFDAYIHQRAPSYQVEYRCRCRDGSYLWIEDRAQVIARNPDHSVARMIGAHRVLPPLTLQVEQLTSHTASLERLVAERTRELEAANQALRKQLDDNRVLAETDSLTGAANRYRFEQVLAHECERARRFRQPLTLIAMDLDDFKRINDTHGHSCGDLALVTVAQLIKQRIRHVDTLARWGGDEFMLVLPGTQQAHAERLAQRLQQQLAALPPVGNHQVAMSFGVVQRLPSDDRASLLLRADRALYRSKAGGKNLICVESP